MIILEPSWFRVLKHLNLCTMKGLLSPPCIKAKDMFVTLIQSHTKHHSNLMYSWLELSSHFHAHETFWNIWYTTSLSNENVTQGQLYHTTHTLSKDCHILILPYHMLSIKLSPGMCPTCCTEPRIQCTCILVYYNSWSDCVYALWPLSCSR